MAKNVARPADPQRGKGDGMKSAFRVGADKGKPTVAKDPERKKGDGVKAAQSDQGKKPSKLSPMGAAKKAVR